MPTPACIILVVDDDALVVKAVVRMLRSSGYGAEGATGGAEGVERLRELGDRVACVLLDLTMPAMSGPDTVVAMREVRSDVRVVLMSGAADDSVEGLVEAHHLHGYLSKPFGKKRLLDAVDRAISD